MAGSIRAAGASGLRLVGAATTRSRTTRTFPFLEIVEAAYRVEQPAASWLAGVTAAVHAGLEGATRGTSGYFVDLAVPDGFRAWGVESHATPDADATRVHWENWNAHEAPAVKAFAHRFGPCGTLVDLVEAGVMKRADAHVHAELIGSADVFGLNAIDAAGQGCAFGAPMAEYISAPLDDATRWLWSRVAAHVATGCRLQRLLAGAPEPVSRGDAVLEPSGRVVHATGAARDELAREALRAAVVDAERARRSEPHDADEAASLWRAMVQGRWSMAEHFERDGRRYVVAYRNEPAVAPKLGLTARERQVLRAVALGHSNKLIAYELGVARTTVAQHVARVARKLGASSRVELVAQAAKLADGGP